MSEFMPLSQTIIKKATTSPLFDYTSFKIKGYQINARLSGARYSASVG
jgi:hypothetical protein